jgi:LuxR family maltose regulon positive regulatory protein
LRSGIAYSRGDIKSALELGKEALSLLPPDELDVRSGVGMNLGYIYWQRGHFKEAEPLLTEAYEAGRQVGNYYNAAAALSLLGDMDVYKGKLRRAAGRHQQAIELAGASPAAAVTHQSLSALYYEWNDLEAAVHHGQRAIELGQLTGGRDFLARVNAILARCILAQNDEAGAMKALENSCLIAHNIILPSARVEHAAYHILIALTQGDLATASKWGSKMAEDAGALPFYFNHIPALLLIEQGEGTTAAEKLQALYEETIQGGAQSQIVKIRLYQALAAGTTESALRFLADVLAMAEPEGYIRSFVDRGRLLAPLLRQAISRGISPEYAGKLLTIIEAEEQQKQKAKGGEMLLSKRELEILRLLAEGLSNQQIADKLVISYSTTKNHIHNILEKLNVQRRTQAVAQARELKLL